jgi:hypothetical protein
LPKAAIIRTGRRRILELSKIVLYLADATYIGLGVGCICALVRADQSTSLNHLRNLSENYASGYPDSISFWQHWSNFEDAYLNRYSGELAETMGFPTAENQFVFILPCLGTRSAKFVSAARENSNDSPRLWQRKQYRIQYPSLHLESSALWKKRC